MKILIITNKVGDKSGWGRYSIDVISNLIREGNEVVVICNARNDDLKNIIQLDVLPAPLMFKRNFFLSIFYAFRVKNRAKDIDIIHCFVEPYVFIAFVLAKMSRVSYFITIHGSYGIKCFYNRFYKFLQITAYKSAKKIFCVSNYTKNRILEYVDLNNLIVIPNGVNLNKFFSKSKKVKKEDIVLGVGALKRRKGYHVSLRALREVKKLIPYIKYYIVGDRSDKKYYNFLNNIIIDLNLEDNVVFLENINDRELIDLYKKSKVFILTPLSSQYNFEGFGLVYLEANSFGIPVIGSYGNGGEDAIRNNYNGLLTEPDNYKDIANKLTTLMINEELHKKISNNSLMTVNDFSWNNIIKKYIKAYKN